MSYRYLNHTSDLGVEISGQDLPELFTNAARAVFDNILNLDAVEPRERREIRLSAATTEELFLNWLRELLFKFATEFFVVRDVRALDIATPHGKEANLTAQVCGERFDAQRHRVKLEIKTPTYHRFGIVRTGSGYCATVIFDV